MPYENILAAIGNTPMVELKKINPNPNAKIYAKLEGFNPSGSIKDRIALYMINEAEDRKSTRLNSSHIPLSRMPSSA